MERLVAIRKNGVDLPGVLNDVTTADYRAQITLNYNQTSLTKTADDFFDALRQIRLELETQNAMILCNGARIDAYPSGMSRQMSLGLIVYLNQMGPMRIGLHRLPSKINIIAIGWRVCCNRLCSNPSLQIGITVALT